MKLIRYNPTSGINPYNEIDRLFENAFNGFGQFQLPFNGFARGTPQSQPAVDFNEDTDNYFARFELPGVKKGDIQLELDENLLTLKGERKEKTADGEKSFTLSRTISVPEGIDADKLSAKLSDGLLTVTLPKPEASKPRQIAVK